MEDHRDDADAADDLDHENGVVGPEAPEADALEQAAEVRPAGDEDAGGVGEVPEADALEQRRALGGDEDDEERR
jgi:hypothetical protein